MNIGCGNGRIQEGLYEDGYEQIFNNDISETVIAQMNEHKKARGHYQMAYDVMDATNMEYPDCSFDLVLDKSTLDTMLCSESPILKTAKMLG